MRTVFLLFLMSLSCAGTASATGIVRGRVTDLRTGTGVANATVEATSPFALVTTTTDRNGYYVFMSLPDGETAIRAGGVAGYGAFTIVRVCVGSDIARSVSIALPPFFPMISSATYPQWRCYFGGD